MPNDIIEVNDRVVREMQGTIQLCLLLSYGCPAHFFFFFFFFYGVPSYPVPCAVATGVLVSVNHLKIVKKDKNQRLPYGLHSTKCAVMRSR